MVRGGTHGLVVWLLLAGGCLASDAPVCDDRICPPDRVCSAHGCVLPEQVTACEDAAEGAPCAFAGTEGRCRTDACIPLGCGDATVLAPEQCDGVASVTETCEGLGFHGGGPVGCTTACTFDTSGCEGRCGDGVINGGERCDGAALDGAACPDFGFYGADGLTCNAACTFDVGRCTGRCGDGIVNGDEDCDGLDLAGTTCRDLGYYELDALECTPVCTFATDACVGFCGDEEVNGPELCDGGAPPELSCLAFGYGRGLLDCSNVCSILDTGCGHVGWHEVGQVAIGAVDLWAAASERAFAVGGSATIRELAGGTWTSVTPVPGAALWAVWGSAADDVFAVGDGGVVLHRDAVGWQDMSSGIGQDLYDVWGVAPDAVFAAAGDGGVYRYDGTAWSLHPGSSGLVTYLDRIWASGPDDIFAAGAEMIHFDGDGWSVIPTGHADYTWSIWGSGPDDVYQLTHDSPGGYAYKLHHYDGTRWQLETVLWEPDFLTQGTYSPTEGHVIGGVPATWHRVAGGWYPVRPADGESVDQVSTSGDRLLGTGTGTFRSTGMAWATPQTVGPSGRNAVWGVSATDVYAAGACAQGIILPSPPPCSSIVHYDGSFWDNEDLGTTKDTLHGLWGSGPDHIVAVGEDGQVVTYDGSAWTTTVEASNAVTLRAVWGVDASTVWAVGDRAGAGNGALLRFDGAWAELDSGTPHDLNAIWGVDAATVFIVGDGGTILSGGAGGFTAMTVPAGVTADLYGVWGTGPADVWAVGADGTVLRHDGVAWTALAIDAVAGHDLYAVWGTSPDDVFLLGDVLAHWDGAAFSQVISQGPLRAAWGGREAVFMATHGGGLEWSQVHTLLRFESPLCHAAEGDCSDGLDADCDDAVDCADDDCATDAACEAVEVSCADGHDNDADGLADCRDPDCVAGCRCGGALPLLCGTTVSGATSGSGMIDVYGCGGRADDGPETVYRLMAPYDADITVNLTGMTADLDLTVIGDGGAWEGNGGGGECDHQEQCIATSQTGGAESVTFSAWTNEVYFIAVDGYAGAQGAFQLEVGCW